MENNYSALTNDKMSNDDKFLEKKTKREEFQHNKKSKKDRNDHQAKFKRKWIPYKYLTVNDRKRLIEAASFKAQKKQVNINNKFPPLEPKSKFNSINNIFKKLKVYKEDCGKNNKFVNTGRSYEDRDHQYNGRGFHDTGIKATGHSSKDRLDLQMISHTATINFNSEGFGVDDLTKLNTFHHQSGDSMKGMLILSNFLGFNGEENDLELADDTTCKKEKDTNLSDSKEPSTAIQKNDVDIFDTSCGLMSNELGQSKLISKMKMDKNRKFQRDYKNGTAKFPFKINVSYLERLERLITQRNIENVQRNEPRPEEEAQDDKNEEFAHTENGRNLYVIDLLSFIDVSHKEVLANFYEKLEKINSLSVNLFYFDSRTQSLTKLKNDKESKQFNEFLESAKTDKKEISEEEIDHFSSKVLSSVKNTQKSTELNSIILLKNACTGERVVVNLINNLRLNLENFTINILDLQEVNEMKLEGLVGKLNCNEISSMNEICNIDSITGIPNFNAHRTCVVNTTNFEQCETVKLPALKQGFVSYVGGINSFFEKYNSPLTDNSRVCNGLLAVNHPEEELNLELEAVIKIVRNRRGDSCDRLFNPTESPSIYTEDEGLDVRINSLDNCELIQNFENHTNISRQSSIADLSGQIDACGIGGIYNFVLMKKNLNICVETPNNTIQSLLKDDFQFDLEFNSINSEEVLKEFSLYLECILRIYDKNKVKIETVRACDFLFLKDQNLKTKRGVSEENPEFSGSFANFSQFSNLEFITPKHKKSITINYGDASLENKPESANEMSIEKEEYKEYEDKDKLKKSDNSTDQTGFTQADSYFSYYTDNYIDSNSFAQNYISVDSAEILIKDLNQMISHVNELKHKIIEDKNENNRPL